MGINEENSALRSQNTAVKPGRMQSGRIVKNRQRASSSISYHLERRMNSEDQLLEASALKKKVKPRKIMDVVRISGRDKGIVGVRKIQDNLLSELEVKHRGNLVRNDVGISCVSRRTSM